MRHRYREPKIKKQGKYFVIRITGADGVRRYIKLGTTLSEARTNYRDYLEQLLSQSSDYPDYKVNIQQGVDLYLEVKRKQLGSPNSFKRYSEIMVNFKRVLVIKYPRLVYLEEIKEFRSLVCSE